MYQSLENFLLSLSLEERKHFIEVELPKLLMGEPYTVLKRTAIKLSTDLSEDEIRQAISEISGKPPERLPEINFDEEKRKIRNESDKVKMIIKDYKGKLDTIANITQDKYDELQDVGKFILFANEKFKIDVPSQILKFPDFIISFENQKIGLEHTRLINEETKATIKTAKYYIEKAQEIIRRELNFLSKTVNIFIDYNHNVVGLKNFKNRQFTIEQKKELVHTIAKYIKSELTGGNTPKPDFISQIKITSNKDSRVDLELAESYYTNQEFTDILLQRIQKKEIKANNYRIESNLSIVWLLIVIDDVHSFSGFDLKTAKFPQIENSNFDSIFVFEKFGGNIYTLFRK
jgi:hypothetical protein